MDLSPATTLAWQAAADEAMHQGSALLEPHHLLIGACSLEKIVALNTVGQDAFPETQEGEIEREANAWAAALAEAAIDNRSLRRALREAAGSAAATGSEAKTTKIRRSPESQQVFARAEVLAATEKAKSIQLVHLGGALLEVPEEKIDAAFRQLGKQKVDLQLSLRRRVALLAREELAGAGVNGPAVEITQDLDASVSPYPAHKYVAADQARAALLYELPLLFGGGAAVTDLLQETLLRIQRVIPAASHAALLAKDRSTQELLLLAHVPAGAPAVSLTLATQVMESNKACIWIRGQHKATASLDTYGVHSGIYAPLLWQNETLGVFLVSSKDSETELTREDLKLIVALAHHAAMALASARLQNDLRRKSELLERMLTNFSPRIRSALLERASRGTLRLGGEKSEVTVLCSDVRGFTKTSEKLSTDEIVELLNDYFEGLVDAIFQNDGTIDKFLGDGILAVFGSPERDDAQHRKALRAALAMQDVMKKRNQVRGSRGLTTCEIGIGIHCGEVFHGFIGTPNRMEFTVIGDAVNRTARYCAGALGGEILLSPQLFQRAWSLAEVEPSKIGTKHEGEFEAYRLKGLRGEH